MSPSRHLLLALGFACWSSTTWAHDVWLKPTSMGPAATDELVKVELWQGHQDAPEVLPRNERRLLRLEAIGPQGEVLEMPGLHARTPAGVFRPASTGVWTLIYEGRPAPYSLSSERFETYLREEGLEHVATTREQRGTTHTSGRELVSRSLKALLAVGDSRLEDRPVGLPVELVFQPSNDPSELELLLLIDGTPAPSILVDLQQLDPEVENDGTLKTQARTNRQGLVKFPAGQGTWMAAAVVSNQIEHSDAEWRTVFSTLTFRINP